jgi:hypothetical protein
MDFSFLTDGIVSHIDDNYGDRYISMICSDDSDDSGYEDVDD